MTTILTGAGKDVTGSYTMQTDNALLSYGGTFSGESFTISMLVAGVPEPIPNGTVTAGGQQLLRLVRGKVIQVTTSDGGGSPSINVIIDPIY